MQAKAAFLGLALALAGCTAVDQRPSVEESYSPFIEANGVNFDRVDPSVLLKQKISDLGGAQGKFETNGDFEARISKIKPFEVCQTVSADRLKLDPESGSALYREWLPDAQLAEYREKNEEIFKNSDVYYPSVQVARASRKVGEYVGQNAFGASATVEMGEADVIHLVFDPIPKKAYMFPQPYIEVDAGSIAGKLDKFQLCISAVPVAPYYREGVMARQATIQNPSASIVTHQMLRVKIGKVRIADMAGRTISEKFVFGTGQI